MAERHPLVESIYRVVSEGAEVSEKQAQDFGHALAGLVTARLSKDKNREFTLRMSNIGKGSRQLWYDKRYGSEETFPPHTLVKFMFGDIIEHLLLFLAAVGGHNVSACQAEVAIDGIKGHVDADIDGVTVDVKSASTHAFKKFADGTLPDNDAFGYMEQIAAYSEARDTDGAFLAMDKQNGYITYLAFDKEDLKKLKIRERIAEQKKAVYSDELPERCYEDEEEGKSGNRSLGVNCSYCPHNTRCWADSNSGMGLRVFRYASGPKFLTKVVVEPKVQEITQFQIKED